MSTIDVVGVNPAIGGLEASLVMINALRLAVERQRLERAQAHLRAERTQLPRYRAQLDAAAGQNQELLYSLDAMEQRLAQAEESVRSAQSFLERAGAEGHQNRQAVVEQLQGIREATGICEESLTRVADVSAAVTGSLRSLGISIERDEGERQQLEAMAEESARLSREVQFVSQDPQLRVPAMATLSAMQANGYVLRETVDKDGLVGYFQDREKTHQIAVRIQPPEQAGSGHSERWRMEVETFHLAGEECLYVLEDFVEGVKETSVVAAELVERRYPKRDGESGIPLPRQREKEQNGRAATIRRERE
ncbi:MAG: hypothetical protein HY675_04215 [Chloroflexi bacterium]|nr:hypothetical protein [Chloroflexota bacterium]